MLAGYDANKGKCQILCLFYMILGYSSFREPSIHASRVNSNQCHIFPVDEDCVTSLYYSNGM